MESVQLANAVATTQAICDEQYAVIHGSAVLQGHEIFLQWSEAQYQVLPMSLNQSVTDEYEPDLVARHF